MPPSPASKTTAFLPLTELVPCTAFDCWALASLHHFCAPKIMQMHDPAQSPIVVVGAIDDDKRSNLHLFHARQCGGCELQRPNGFWSSGHRILRCQIKRVFAALLEQTSQITIADHSE